MMAIEKRGVLKRERKIKQESEEKNNKDTVIECGAVRRSDMDHEKRRHRRLEARWTWRRMEKISWTNIKQLKMCWKRLEM